MKNHFIFNKELVKESIKKAGLTYAELAKIFADNNVNITEQSIKLWFIKNNANTPDIQKATILSRILNIPLNEILYSDDLGEVFAGDNGSQKVALLEMRAGFGTEGTLDPEFKVERCIKLPQEFLGKVNAKYAKIIQCYGDSMLPEFNDGDYILVEMLGGRDYIKRPSIYLVRLGDVVYIKRIEFLPNNDIRLISINPAYPPFLASETGYEWEILGAVYGKISVKLGSGFQFLEQGVKGK